MSGSTVPARRFPTGSPETDRTPGTWSPHLAQGGTLASRLERRDASRFVGRGRELARFDALFVDDPPASVIHVHGPGGIGKSTLLRELARRGRRHGWTVHRIEGGDLPPVPNALEVALERARVQPQPLLLFDTYERMAGVDKELRARILPSMPERTIVVVAGRRAPARGWFEEGWERVTIALALAPLSLEESLDLLRAHGVTDERRAGQLARRAEGFPLALALLADADAAGDVALRGLDHPEVARSLMRRLTESELDEVALDALAVACIARSTTRDLLADVLGDDHAREAYEWLCSRTFAERTADGLALHELVRHAARAELRRSRPDRERELRRRIVDHLHARAVAGDLLLTIDLAHLPEDRLIRSGYSWDGSRHHRMDQVRPGDADRVAELLRNHGWGSWWPGTREFFERAPERVAIARDSFDRISGYLVAVTPANAPAFADDDPVLGPRLLHARRHVPDGNAVLWREAADFTGDPHSRVLAMVAMTGVLRSGLSNPRYAYVPIDPSKPLHRAFSAALGGRHLPGLDSAVGPPRFECHLLDYGPGGLLGAQRDLVYSELGLAPPREEPRPVRLEAVREALRNLHVPHRLAQSELAHGDSPTVRAASVRIAIDSAVAHAFGDSDDELLLARVFERGYLDPARSHEEAAAELFMSRSTYFRRLRAATDRVARHIVQS